MRVRLAVGALASFVAVVLAACSSDSDDASRSTTTEAPATDLAVVAGEPFPDARCDANRDAGTITFLTGFDYAAAASIVEVTHAEVSVPQLQIPPGQLRTNR